MADQSTEKSTDSSENNDSHNDPFLHQKLRDKFEQELRNFHSTRGTPFNRLPCISGKAIDLLQLYRSITEVGGCDKATEDQRWEDMQSTFNIPHACTNAAQALRQIYIRYLLSYEKAQTAEPTRNSEYLEDHDSKMDKRSKIQAVAVPLSYNHLQHNVPVHQRVVSGLSTELVPNNRHVTLERALLSGLPNEVDFAMNVCTLLSSEGKHTLKLPTCPRLVPLLLGHVGVFDDGPASLYDVYQYSWTNHCNRKYLRFWYDSVDKKVHNLLIPGFGEDDIDLVPIASKCPTQMSRTPSKLSLAMASASSSQCNTPKSSSRCTTPAPSASMINMDITDSCGIITDGNDTGTSVVVEPMDTTSLESTDIAMKSSTNDDTISPQFSESCQDSKLDNEYVEIQEHLFNLGPDVGYRSVEGQRIEQVALLFRNLSFEEVNMHFLANSTLFYRFLMMCIHSKYSCLRQLALDTIGNMAGQIELVALGESAACMLLELIHTCISSADRYEVVRGLEILTGLSQVSSNDYVLCEQLKNNLYECIVNLMCVHDIQLIVYTLECMYHLTEMGEFACTNIAKVSSSIGMLVNLMTIEAQSYGPNSLTGIKVVEHIPAALSQQYQQQYQQRAQMAPPQHPMHGVMTSQHLPSQYSSAVPSMGANAQRQPPPLQRPQAPTPPHMQPPKQPITAAPFMHPRAVLQHRATLPPPHLPPPNSQQPHHSHNMPPTSIITPPPHRGGTPNASSRMMPPHAPVSLPPPPALPVHRQHMQPPPAVRAATNGINKKPSPADQEIYTKSWLSAHYEYCPGSPDISRNALYGEFMNVCGRNGMTCIPNLQTFERSTRATFPQMEAVRIKVPNRTEDYQYKGIRVKTKLAPNSNTAYPVPKVKFPVLHNTHMNGDVNDKNHSTTIMNGTTHTGLQNGISTPEEKQFMKSFIASKVRAGIQQNNHSAMLQVDGSDDLRVPQLDGAGDTPPTSPRATPKGPRSQSPASQKSPHASPRAQPVPSRSPKAQKARSISPHGSSPRSASKSPHPHVTPPLSPLASRSPKSKYNLEVCVQAAKAAEVVPENHQVHEKRIERVENHCSPSKLDMNAGLVRQLQGEDALDVMMDEYQMEAPRAQMVTEAAMEENNLNTNVSNSNADGDNKNVSTGSKPVISAACDNNPLDILCDNSSVMPQPPEKDVIVDSHRTVDRSSSVPVSNGVQKDQLLAAIKNTTLEEEVSVSKKSGAENKNGFSNGIKPCILSVQVPNSVSYPNNCTVNMVFATNQPNTQASQSTQPLPAASQSSANTVPAANISSSMLAAQLTRQLPEQQLVVTTIAPQTVTVPPSAQQQLPSQLPLISQSNASVSMPPPVASSVPQRVSVGLPSVTGQTCATNSKGQTVMIRLATPQNQPRPFNQNLVPPVPSNPIVVSTTQQSAYIKGSILTPAQQPLVNTVNNLVTHAPQQHAASTPIGIVPTVSTSGSGVLPVPLVSQAVRPPLTGAIPSIDATAAAVKRTASHLVQPNSVKKQCTTPVSGTLPVSGTVSTPSSIAAGGPVPTGSVHTTPINPLNSGAIGTVNGYKCMWEHCQRRCEGLNQMKNHVLKEHFDRTAHKGICRWVGCDGVVRQRWAMVTHLQEKHLTEAALKASQQMTESSKILKRAPTPTSPALPATPMQTSQTSTQAPPTSSNDAPAAPPPKSTPSYPIDAAIQAIRRFASRPPYPEFMEMKEGPVTKHIRLTSGLILRNIARYSPTGRRLLRKHEKHLSCVALSNVESSTAVAHCLSELQQYDN